jgi:hypothetical protein
VIEEVFLSGLRRHIAQINQHFLQSRMTARRLQSGYIFLNVLLQLLEGLGWIHLDVEVELLDFEVNADGESQASMVGSIISRLIFGMLSSSTRVSDRLILSLMRRLESLQLLWRLLLRRRLLTGIRLHRVAYVLDGLLALRVGFWEGVGRDLLGLANFRGLALIGGVLRLLWLLRLLLLIVAGVGLLLIGVGLGLVQILDRVDRGQRRGWLVCDLVQVGSVRILGRILVVGS